MGLAVSHLIMNSKGLPTEYVQWKTGESLYEYTVLLTWLNKPACEELWGSVEFYWPKADFFFTRRFFLGCLMMY